MKDTDEINRELEGKVQKMLDRSTPGNSWGSASNAVFFGVLAVVNILAEDYWVAYAVATLIPAGTLLGGAAWRKWSRLRDLMDKSYQTSMKLPLFGEVVCYVVVFLLALRAEAWVPAVLDFACFGMGVWNRKQALRRLSV